MEISRRMVDSNEQAGAGICSLNIYPSIAAHTVVIIG